MEFQKMVNLFDTTSDDKDLQRFVTKNWILPMLRSDLCDFSDAYIIVKGTITVTDPDNTKRNKCCI